MGEGECGSSTPSNSKHATTASDIGGGGTATKFLANLPSRGLFSSTVISSNPVISFPLPLFANACVNFCLRFDYHSPDAS
nr:uncharacterized protein LOC109192614 [Ipomoea trifida]